MKNSPVTLRLPAALADRYAIQCELGAGGMATVYLAHDVRHDRNVALTVLRPERSAILRVRIARRRVATHPRSCYNAHMDTTIRNLDERVYRSLKARAALAGKTIGEAVNEALRAYLARPDLRTRQGSLRDITPDVYPKGSERLSEEIDAIVYGR